MENTKPTPISSRNQKFKLSPGYIVLKEISLVGVEPEENDPLFSFFTTAKAARSRAFYLLNKVGISIPFGHFVGEGGKAEIEQEFKELHEIAQGMKSYKFKLELNVTFATLDVNDKILVQRIYEHIRESLTLFRDRLQAKDVERLLYYTQDNKKRLDFVCQGAHSTAIRSAVHEVQSLVKLLKIDETTPIVTPSLDAAIELFSSPL